MGLAWLHSAYITGIGSIWSFGRITSNFMGFRVAVPSATHIIPKTMPAMCVSICPEWSLCHWGLCVCNSGLAQRWGSCLTNQAEQSQGPKEGAPCDSTDECHQIDINMVCAMPGPSLVDQGVCKCREEMQWSPRALQCQVFIDVNCSQFNYSSPVSSFVNHAMTLEEQRRRGYRNDEEQLEKLRLLAPGLDDISLLLNICSFYGGLGFSSHGNTANGKKYPRLEERCRADQRSHILSTFWNPLSNPLPQLASNRSETPAEAIQSSLLELVDPSSLANLAELDELFCRDTEPFSELFEVDDQKNRPASCPPLGNQYCAVLYDSANCSGGWQLNVTVGEQRSFSYFSSDWSYRNDADVVGVLHGCTFTGFTLTFMRNDADVVGVRHGCSFIGFTGGSFDGESFSLSAGDTDRWAVFEKNRQLAHFHEELLSYQCVCRPLT